MPFEQVHTRLEYCKAITVFIAQLVGNVIMYALAYIMLCRKHLQLAFVLYPEMSLTRKYNEEQ